MRSYRGFLRHVLRQAPEPAAETLPAAATCGRVLLRDLVAGVRDPAEARSAMDGYAVRARDLARARPDRPVDLAEAGVTPAGRDRRRLLPARRAHRIMTGGALPAGADSVVPVEQVERHGGQVRFRAAPRRGQHVRRPGENFRKGQRLVRAGTRLRPQEIGLAITAGVPHLVVARRPRVGILATGEELVPPGTKLRRGEVFDSNRPTLLALVAETGCVPVDLGKVGDRPADLRRRIRTAKKRLEFLITIGGVSAGDFDVVKLLVAEFPNVDLVKVAMKPAKPQAFGRLGSLFWYALPGNPVSAMVAFDRFVQPLLLRSMGHRKVFRRPRTGLVTRRLTKRAGPREFVRARAELRDGAWVVSRVGPEGSSNLRSMVAANAYMVLPEECTEVRAGQPVTFELFTDPRDRASF